ncbi:MAG: EamA family transporter, partial [Rhodobacter sp.]|nr:EamA family transporter [Rhodobacter sp.]
MEPWVFITVAAALAQTFRFMLQKWLTLAGLSAGGATFARFLFSAPLAILVVCLYSEGSDQGIPSMPERFWKFAIAGGVAQILATMCVVSIFSHRNFAVGITFKKTEVVMTAIAGFLILGEGVGVVGGIAIGLGLLGVLLISDPPAGTGPPIRRIVNRATGLGLASGMFFAVSAVGYRGASLALESGDTALRAGTTLAVVTTFQTIALAIWLMWRERGQITRVLRAWRVTGMVGLASMIGSFCWFSAFTLQNAAYVSALGQIELIFSIAASTLF